MTAAGRPPVNAGAARAVAVVQTCRRCAAALVAVEVREGESGERTATLLPPVFALPNFVNALHDRSPSPVAHAG